MADSEKMTMQERDKYLRNMQKRYRKADKDTKGKLLDEMETVTELHRKSLTRLMGSNIHRKPRVGRRGPNIWSAGRICPAGDLREPGPHLCRTSAAQSYLDGSSPF
jgi:hypothetical protein